MKVKRDRLSYFLMTAPKWLVAVAVLALPMTVTMAALVVGSLLLDRGMRFVVVTLAWWLIGTAVVVPVHHWWYQRRRKSTLRRDR